MILVIAGIVTNWQTLDVLPEALPAGAMKDACKGAIECVEKQEGEHLEWAQVKRARLVKLQATRDPTAKPT